MSAPPDGRDGLSRPRSRGLPRPEQLHAKVTLELFRWVQETSRAAGITASQWLYDLVQAARERARLRLPQADPQGVIPLHVSDDGPVILLRPIAGVTGELELLVRDGSRSLHLRLGPTSLLRIAAVLAREAESLRDDTAVHAQRQ